MTPARPRIGWIDQARGLGIVLVVIGHVTSAAPLKHWIFLFHMPLFFALSGAVARPLPAAEYARRRARTLIVPYLCYLALVGLADAALSAADGTRPVFAGIGAAGIARRIVLGGTELGTVYGVFWFVPCLFAAGLAYDALVVRTRPGWARGAVAVALALLSYLIPGAHDPLGLLDVPMALFFFWVGGVAMNHEAAPRLAGPALAGVALLFVAAGLASAPFDMKYLMFGTIPANLVAAFAGTLLVAGIAQWSVRVPGLAPVLSVLGRASLVIMFLHQLVHYHLAGRMPEMAVALLAVVLPLAAWWLFGRTAPTRRLLLGIAGPPAEAK